MKRIAVAAVLCSFAAVCSAQSGSESMAVQANEATVTVTKVDLKARTVSFRGPKGGVATLQLPPEAQNIDQVKPGQQYRMKYVESIAVAIKKGGQPSAATSQEMKLAPKGAKPGGVVVRTNQMSAVVDAVDYTSRYVAVRGPKGNTLSLRVADDVKLEELHAGDRIVMTYTEALAIEWVAQAPAKKPATKKEPAAKK